MSQVDDNYKKELILRHVADLAHFLACPARSHAPRPLPLDVEICVENGIVTPEEMGNFFKAELLKIF